MRTTDAADGIARPDLPSTNGGPEPDDEVAPSGELDEHRRRAVAGAGDLPDGAVLSHVSAACLHGLPIWDVPLLHGPVHATRPRPGGPINRVHLTVRVGRLEPDEIDRVDGVPVTAIARTLVDLGRWADLPTAVVCTDAALRDGLVSPTDLQEALERAFGTMGVPRARIAVAFADSRSRSVAESRARVAQRWPYPIPPARRFGSEPDDPSSSPYPDEPPGPYPDEWSAPYLQDWEQWCGPPRDLW